MVIVALDVRRAWIVLRLRWKVGAHVADHADVSGALAAIRKQAALSKDALFLGKGAADVSSLARHPPALQLFSGHHGDATHSGSRVLGILLGQFYGNHTLLGDCGGRDPLLCTPPCEEPAARQTKHPPSSAQARRFGVWRAHKDAPFPEARGDVMISRPDDPTVSGRPVDGPNTLPRGTLTEAVEKPIHDRDSVLSPETEQGPYRQSRAAARARHSLRH